jgi:imidazolonepropionase-like amidohydrolase
MWRAFRCALLGCLCLCSVVSASAPPAPGMPAPEERRFTIFFASRKAGLLTSRIGPDGWRVLDYEVNDRGRGQKLTSRLLMDSRSIPLGVEITGHDYWGNPVEERFERKGDRAVWRNAFEQGERKLAGPAFYLSLKGVQEVGLLATALLQAPEGRLALLPDGEARLEKIGDPVRIGAGDRAKTIDLYAIHGLNYTPVFLWMEKDFFFARFDGFGGAVREGWEDIYPDLIRRHTEAMTAWQKNLASRLAKRPEHGFVVRGARLFDPETKTARPAMTVVVSGNRIQAVGPDGKVAIPEGAEVVDARGKTLLPGLWDMHQHFTQDFGILDLAAGVTTGRDLGNDQNVLLTLKRLWDSGEAIGPRVILAGVIEGPGPLAAPTNVLASTEEEARAWVDRYADAGYVQIKIYSSLKPELVPAVVARAHARGLRVSGHIPGGMKAEQAVRQGFDEVHHANFLFLNFIDGVDTRTPDRMSAVAEHGAGIDIRSEPFRAFLRLLDERHVVIDPTLNVFEDRFLGRAGEVLPSMAGDADRFPPLARRSLFGAGLPGIQENAARFRDSFRNMLALVEALYKQGTPIVAGTDTLPGFALHRELELYVEAGIPAPEALRIATLGAAQVMKLDRDLGTIAPGKLADLILVDGDPAARIHDIRKVVLTVKDGVLYDSAELYRAVGVRVGP